MKFEGVYTPVITPFSADYSIDRQAFAEVIEHQIDAGVHGVIISGTTGESYALTLQERVSCFRLAKDVINKRVPMIAGIGATRTDEVVDLGLSARDLEADALLLPAPAYAVPAQEELSQHALTVDQAVDLPIMLYNYPGRTGVMMDEYFLDRISTSKNICAIKETSGDVNRLHMLANKYTNLQLSCGWDDQVLEFFAWGATSWVAGAANCLPREHIALYEACVLENDFAQGRRIIAAMLPFFQLLDDSGKFVQIIKYASSLAGLKPGVVRRPQLPMSEELEQQVEKMCSELQRAVREIRDDSNDATVVGDSMQRMRSQTA